MVTLNWRVFETQCIEELNTRMGFTSLNCVITRKASVAIVIVIELQLSDVTGILNEKCSVQLHVVVM